MKQLRINITKAQLVSYSVELKEGKPEVRATIALFTEAGKAITTYSISTDSWNNDDKFTLPLELLPLLGDAARILEGVAVRHCHQGQLALPPPKAKPAKMTFKGFGPELDGKTVNLVDQDNQPINLDDIPF